jgi:membrane-associated phospholipid phosphatase
MRPFVPCRLLLHLAIALTFSEVSAQVNDTITVVDTVWHPVITAEDTLRLPLNFDEQLLVDINAIGHDTLPTLDFTMTAFTHSIYVAPIVVPAGLYALGWGRDDHHMAATGMNTVLSEIVAGLTTMTVKAVVRRNRPYATLRGVRIPTGKEIGTSFPSGHSGIAWAMSTSLMIGYPKWYVIVPAALYATTVSLSRPFVGVHYPTDILVGATIGAGAAFLVKALEPAITKTFPSLFPEKKATGEVNTVKVVTIKLGI